MMYTHVLYCPKQVPIQALAAQIPIAGAGTCIEEVLEILNYPHPKSKKAIQAVEEAVVCT